MSQHINPTPKQTDITSLNSNFQDKVRFTFIQISSAALSATNNPLAIADNAVQTDTFEVIYVRVANNADFKDSTPINYTAYEIRHTMDTVTVNAIDYLTGQIKINGRARNGSWGGWKTVTVS